MEKTSAIALVSQVSTMTSYRSNGRMRLGLSIEEDSIEHLLILIRNDFKRLGYKIRKDCRINNSYRITTLEGDCFWLHWDAGDMRSWLLDRTIGKRVACEQTDQCELIIRSTLRSCFFKALDY